MSRRSLLRGAGAGAAGLAAAPWLRHAAALETATPVAGVGDSAWNDLANRLRGRLLRPDDNTYPAATVINATRYMRERPAGYYAAMQPFLAGGAYQNFTDRSQDGWPRAYYGQNLERLVEVKRS